MAVLITVGGKSGGDGFLIAPLGSNYEAEISLKTDIGTASVKLQADPAHNVANLVFSNTGTIALSTTATIATVHSQLQSAARGDTTIQVVDAGTAAVLASFTVTSITEPQINYSGRFEARFATDASFTNTNPIYTAVNDNVVPLDGSDGSVWGLEGEPDFAPGSPVPTDLTLPGMGRNLRLNAPIAQRPLGHDSTGAVNPTGKVPDVVSKVASISGKTGAMPPNNIETFTTGDPLIGQLANFGPDTYLAGNAGSDSTGNISIPMPGAEESWAAGMEPMGLFEIRLGASFSPPAIYFRGASKVGAPGSSGMTGLNKHTRNPDSRPITDNSLGFPDASQDFTDFSLEDPTAFTKNRLDALVFDYQALPAGASPQRRNLVRRIGHLLGYLQYVVNPPDPKVAAVQALYPGVFSIRIPGVGDGLGKAKEVYTGKVDADLHAFPGGSPGTSSVVDYLRQFSSFNVQWHAFAFRSDENCGYHHGSLSGDLSMTGNHIGDPHSHTVNGTAFDFQAVGEFTLLRDGAGMEIQVRQTPVPTAPPIADNYTGITACVSVITAIAARIGPHKISFQPGREKTRLEFYLDGKLSQLPGNGLDLGAARVSTFDANGETGLRVDYGDGTVLTATPRLFYIWILDVTVSNTKAVEGVIGYKPKDSWLPRLRNGVDLGSMPAGVPARFVGLYKTFANSWRVTNKTSLFTYLPGTSTKTFTDPDWPSEKPPCTVKPGFEIPGLHIGKNIPIPEAERICHDVTEKDLHNNCVFDVATTGDPAFAKGYMFAQELRLHGTAVQVKGYVPATNRPDRKPIPKVTDAPQHLGLYLAVAATVRPLASGRPTPTGTVTFFVDGVPMNRPVELDDQGSARVTVGPLKVGEHLIRATYSGGGKDEYHSSSSPNLLHTIPAGKPK